MGVDAADAAEVVFGGAGIELVAAQHLLPCKMRMPDSGTEATMAPRRRQSEQSQRRGSTTPSGKLSSSTTAPQWQLALCRS